MADKVFKGGQGSGNWQHAGRQGIWGGSTSTGGSSEEFLAHPEEIRHSFDIKTGEFNPSRHQKYLDTLDVQEAQDYVEQLEDYVDAEEITDVMGVDDLSGEEIYELIPAQFRDSYNPVTGEFDIDKHVEKIAEIEGVSVSEANELYSRMELSLVAEDYDIEVSEFEHLKKDDYLEERIEEMVNTDGPDPQNGWAEDTNYDDIPLEIRGSFDPDTGDFDRTKHFSKLDYIQMELMSRELAQEYDEAVRQYYSEGSYEPAQTIDEIIDDDGEIDRENMHKLTRFMSIEEKYNTTMEIVDTSLEQKIQELEDRFDIKSAELKYRTTDDAIIVGYDKVQYGTIYGDRKIVPGTQYTSKIDEFNELDNIVQQREYIEQIEQELETATELEDKRALNNIKDICKNSISAERIRAGLTDDPIEDVILGYEERGNDVDFNAEAMSTNVEQRVWEAVDFFGDHGVLDKFDNLPVTVSPKVGVVELAAGERAYAVDSHNTIYLPEDASTKTVVHELGHLVHRNMSENLEFAVNEMFERRIEGHEIKPIYTGTDEVGYTEAFMSKYSGKVYSFEKDNKFGEEVLSTGFAEMYDDPVAFREEDKEHFNLTYAALKGLF